MHSVGNAAETAAVRSVLLELLGDVDAIAERFVVALTQVVPYSDGAVDRAQLLADGVNTYERVLRRLVGMPVPERFVELSRGLGRHRAQLDVPLSAVTTGTRLHFRIVWEELAERLPPDALVAMVTLPVQLWQAVEEHSTDVQIGYHEAATALAFERDRDRRRVVEAFLDSDGEDGELLARAAGVLGAGTGDDVFVAFVPGRARQAVTALAARGGVHLHEWHGGTVVLAHRPRGTWPLDAGTSGRPVVPAALRAVPCGVGPLAHGVGRVPRALRVAQQVAGALPATAAAPARLAGAAVAVAASALGGLREDLARDVLHELLVLAPPERDRLLETVDAYAATGSVATTAERTFCHRNTVLNRLRRVAECTGLDITVPAQASVLLLALTAWRWQDG
ncbi:helix-turn-helix domain-containing protein [Kineococcus sp. SYSU DK006]|uniref:helix-turn-helix domain-containing protein n=1 Tax=Kineococcus sp. SYSU DK006 TaxID=3383127 RepID=UPI003D7DC8C2